MLTKVTRFTAAALVFAAIPAFAQPPEPPPRPPVTPATPAAPPATTDASGTLAYRAKGVIGSRVSIRGDIAVGIVDDIVFNDRGIIEYLVVVNENRFVTVPWQATKFNYDRRTAFVDIAQDRFRRVPTYTATTYPNYFAPRYRSEIIEYYGLSPIENRRIERRP